MPSEVGDITYRRLGGTPDHRLAGAGRQKRCRTEGLSSRHRNRPLA
jgi:hypothetical protein